MQYAEKFVLWLCPACGRTVRCPEWATYAPNTTCQCTLLEFITQMVLVWPRVDTPQAIAE
jgi:hypothetical protein